jgi:hypothetical protein
LEDAIEVWVQLYYPDENGVTNNDRYEHIEKTTGIYPGPDLKIPTSLQYLWDFFTDLNSSRGSGWGNAPLTYTEIKSWCELYEIHLSGWELSTLKQMDSKFLQSVGKLDKKRTKKK